MTKQPQEDENPHQKLERLRAAYMRTPIGSDEEKRALEALREWRLDPVYQVYSKLIGARRTYEKQTRPTQETS